MQNKKTKMQRNMGIAIVLTIANCAIFAYGESIPGLNALLNDAPSPQASQPASQPSPQPSQLAGEIPDLMPKAEKPQPANESPAVVPLSPPASNAVPTVTPKPLAPPEGSVYMFPLPLDKVKLPSARPQNLSSLLPAGEDLSQGDTVKPLSSPAVTGQEISSIISDAEIQELLGDGPFPDNGRDHQVVRMKVEHVPLAPPRPIDSILTAIDSQPVTVDAPITIAEGILMANTPNPAQKGSGKIVIRTAPPRPQGLKAPKGASLPRIEDSIVTPTINSGGRLRITYKKIRSQKIGSCYVRGVRQVTAVGKTSILPAAIMRKDFSEDIARFERDVLQPAARRHYGVPVTQMKHLSSYRCSNIAGTRNLSEHSKANALDVSSFVFADGRSVSLIKGWGGTRRERKFLRELKAGACKIFGTTLTPNYNRDHYNHFHFDGKTRKSKNICN